METSIRTLSAPSGLSRRTVMKTAAWSVPVVAMAVTAPMAAASTTPFVCPELNTGSFIYNLAAGTLQDGSGVETGNGWNGWKNGVYWEGPKFPRSVPGLLSIQNNAARTTQSSHPDAVFTYTATFAVESGKPYAVAFAVLGAAANRTEQFPSGRENEYQKLEFSVDGDLLWADATKPVEDLPGNLTVEHGSFDVTRVVTSVQTTMTIEFRFTLPPKIGGSLDAANDDIIISLPTLTCL